MMLKKILVMVGTLVVVFFSGFAMNQTLFANSPKLQGSTTEVAGTIDFHPRNGISNEVSPTKLYIGDNVYSASNQVIVWEVIKQNENFDQNTGTGRIFNGEWILQPYGYITTAKFTLKDKDWWWDGVNAHNNIYTYESSLHAPIVKNINDTAFNNLEKRILVENINTYSQNLNEPYIFTPNCRQFCDNGIFNMNPMYRATLVEKDQRFNGYNHFYASYILSSTDHCPNGGGMDGVYSGLDGEQPGLITLYGVSNTEYGIRPVTLIKDDDIVFAMQSLPSVSEPARTKIKTGSPDDEALKMRIYDSSLSVKLNQASNFGSYVAGAKIGFEYSGATVKDDAVISVIITNSKNDILYYQMMEPAKSGSGNMLYFDTLGLVPSNDYYLQIVEEIVTADNHPTLSSRLSEKYQFSVLEEPIYTYEENYVSGTAYEYSKNVRNGDEIGSIKMSGGVRPVDIDIIKHPNASAEHENDYKNFTAIENTSADTVPIFVNNSKGLDAGDYYFRIEVTSGGVVFTKDITLTVNKTDPQVSFTKATDTNVSYMENKIFRESIQHLNTDKNDADYEIEYIPSNNVLMAETDADDEDAILTINAFGDKGEVELIAIVHETENFYEGETTKTINVYEGMNGWFESIADPLKASMTDARGKEIGTLEITGGLQPYTYAVEAKPNGKADANKDGRKFEFEEGSNKVILRSSLLPGSYNVTFKVTDYAGETFYLEEIIKVVGETQSGFEFYDYLDESKICTNMVLKIPFNTSDAKLIAKGGNTTGVKYALAEGENDMVIKINELTGGIKVLGTGKVKVQATLPANSIYSSITIFMYVEITQGELSDFTFTLDHEELPNFELITTYAPNKQHQLGIKDLPIGSKVKWELDMDENGMSNGVKVDDIVSVDETSGIVSVLNANKLNQTNVHILATVDCPGYVKKELDPILVTVNQAEQSKFRFTQKIYQMPYGSGSFSPRFKDGAIHDDGTTYNTILSCDDLRVTVNKDTFKYQVEEENGASITIKAKNRGNRNYKPAEATAELRVMKPGETLANVIVDPGSIITYGESITITPVDNEAGVTYTYESMDETILAQDSEHPNTFLSKDVSESVQILVTKNLPSYEPSETLVTIQINPKPIEVELVKSYVIKAGEPIPNFELKDFKSGDILPKDVLPKPIIQTTLTDTLVPGVYPIMLSYPDEQDAHKYDIRLKKASLTIEENKVDNGWLRIYQADDATKTSIDQDTWYNKDLIVEIIDAATGYDEISLDQVLWDKETTVSTEGDQTIQVYMRNSTTGSISEPVDIKMKIDKTAPSVPVFTIQSVNTSTFAQMINAITFGSWMNKQQEVTMTSSDEASGVHHYEYTETMDGKDTVKKSTNGIIRYRDQISVSIKGKACDKAGNCSTYSEAETIQIDTEAPSISGVKDQAEYKQYYLPRFVSVSDRGGSGLKIATYKKDDKDAGKLIEDVETKIKGEGSYHIEAEDHAGNQTSVKFKIVKLSDIETEIDGSDESRDVIDQIQDEFDEVKDKIDEIEQKEYEEWLEEANKKWEEERKKVLIDEETKTKVEGIGETTFDPKTELVVEEIAKEQIPALPKNAIKTYHVYLKKGNTVIQPDGRIKVYLPYTEEAKPIVYQIDEQGNVKGIAVTLADGYVSFITDTLMKYAISNENQEDNNRPDTNPPDTSGNPPDTEGNPPDEKPKVCDLNDGKTLNVDTDGDGLPDINLDSDKNCVADLNIDLDDDLIPDINIDSNGSTSGNPPDTEGNPPDGKTDINIDTDGDGYADVNIIKVNKWIPNKDVTINGFSYDTMTGLQPDLNIDTDGDGTPDRNVDTDKDGLPDVNVDDDWFTKRGIKDPNKKDVQKSYDNAIGGANTGDVDKWTIWWVLFISTTLAMIYQIHVYRKQKQS